MSTVTSFMSDAAGWSEQLLREGYCIIPDALPRSVLGALQADLETDFRATPMCQGRFYGERTKRFGSLLRRSARTSALMLNPTILTMVEAALGGACDRIQLNVAQAIEIYPGEARQLPHRDHDMWRGEKGAHEYLVNVIWPLSPFRRENGATLIYPRSHGRDGMAREDLGEPIAAECDPGAAICFLGSTAHGAGANTTDLPRRGIVIGYCLGWLRSYENQSLAYPPAIARTFPRELAELVGYVQHRPNLGNYEGQCPSILLGDNVPERIGAIDALRPDQEAMLATFADESEP
ncbi:phytanoyl-CoA dioxygenase family protein [uncultured Sphingomonas sp.]|uniref:phytanoyl-CoA dioxygenase family protein n=1 Tax=uncultured Sphingomonas sp. TaxID=158754 RepID=UPI00261209B3|nr:phytanoyl-CoA dioxygenase family protein [uncultured Sphingomonas sp.]